MKLSNSSKFIEIATISVCSIVALLTLYADDSYAQYLTKRSYTFESPDPLPRLAANSVSDIIVTGEKLWFGTGGGLSSTEDGGITWVSYDERHGIGKGGVSAVAVRGDTIWVATAFDSLIEGEGGLPTGGMAKSTNGGETWMRLKRAGVTPVFNISYDIAFLDTSMWTANYGAGLQRSNDGGLSWEIVTPDTFLFDSWGNLNHRVFSVIAVEDTLWVGTAKGVNKSIDGGETWRNFNHQNQDFPISGNFIGALAHQRLQDKSIIWAATRAAEDPDEYHAVSKSSDGGRTWSTVLDGEFAHNFKIDGATIYVVTDNGLFKSVDGEEFFQFPPIADEQSGEKIYTTKYYSAGVDLEGYLWVGTADGLAKSNDNGNTWRIFRSFVPTGIAGEPRTYAYPNPFSPLRHNQIANDGFVRLQYNTTSPTSVTIRIYDFALELVATVVEGAQRSAGDFAEVWNGKNDAGRMVANGVYFYSVDLEGDGLYWGKIMVLN